MMMTLNAGIINSGSKPVNVRWVWENNHSLLVALGDQDYEIMSMEYEDLIGFAKAIEAIKYDRIKEAQTGSLTI